MSDHIERSFGNRANDRGHTDMDMLSTLPGTLGIDSKKLYVAITLNHTDDNRWNKCMRLYSVHSSRIYIPIHSFHVTPDVLWSTQ
jgi:hypothetical protein